MLGPLFGVEMITGARRATPFALRFALGCILLWGLTVSYQQYRAWGGITTAQAANVAGGFFTWSAWSLMLCVLLAGPALSAGTLAVERDTRTLEYLLATDLTNWEIVLGKVASRLLQLGGVLASSLPIFALAMLLGGIAPQQLWQLSLFLAALLLLVVAISLIVSMHSLRGKDAILLAYRVLILLGVGIPCLGWLLQYCQVLPDWWNSLLQFHPFVSVTSICNQSWAGTSAWPELLLTVGVYFAASVILIGYVTVSLRKTLVSHADGAASVAKAPFATPHRPVSENPLWWKETLSSPLRYRFSWLSILFRIIPALAGIIWVAILALEPPSQGMLQINCLHAAMFVVGSLGTMQILMLGARAARLVSTERERDTWLTLISTPLETKQILRAKLLGNLWTARYVVIFLAAVWLIAACREPRIFPGIPCSILSFVALAYLATGVGLFCSVLCQSTTRAILATLFILFGYGILPFMFLILFVRGGGNGIVQLVISADPPFQMAFPPAWWDKKMDFDGAGIAGWAIGMFADLFLGWGFYSFAVECEAFASDRIAGIATDAHETPAEGLPVSETIV
jgi:ABC-type transport system involved in multi-copper enzyme maturation permease subunit